jgi:two-component system, OmpR family, sensor kinase
MQEDEAQGGRHRTAPTNRLVAAVFLLVEVGLIIGTVFAAVRTQDLQTGTRSIVEDRIRRSQSLDQLDRIVERRRILVDDHIFTKSAREMAGLELQIQALDRQLAIAMHDYTPLVTSPRERAVWDRARGALDSLDEPMATGIALSRANRDVDARETMDQVAGRFEEINRDLDQLDSINESVSTRSLESLESLRRQLQILIFGIGGLALAANALLGRWLSRRVRRRENEMSFEAGALAARNREFDAFAVRVAHDVRTPLASIEQAASALATRVGAEDREIQLLRRGAQRIEALKDELLTLALSEGAAQGWCDPARIAVQVEDDFRTVFEAERGALRVEVMPAEVGCSAGLLYQALTNLLDNGVKYHRPSVAPHVKVVGAAIDGGYDLRVTDNGIGMSREEAGHVFEPFYRSPRTKDTPGKGLGLSIVKRVAEVSGGWTAVETVVGQGSTFVMHMPLAARRNGGMN